MPPIITRPEVYVGIDPGSAGGIAYFSSGIMQAEKFTGDYTGIKEQVFRIAAMGNCHWVIEDVHGYMGPNRPAGQGNPMFNFGENKGFWKMAVACANGYPEQIPSSVCFKEFGMKKEKGESDTSWKNRLKVLAQQMFPNVKMTLAICDAVLFAEYCHRLHKGLLVRQKGKQKNAPNLEADGEMENAQEEMERLHRLQSVRGKKGGRSLPW